MIELRMREASAVSAVFTLGGLNSRIDITEEVGTPTVVVTGFPIPGLVGSAYSGTLVADMFTDTSIELPSSGWIRLVGSVGGGSGFALSIPVSLIDDLVEEDAGQEPADLTSIKFNAAPGTNVFIYVAFGHDAAGNILIASNSLGAATLSVYEE